MMSLEKPFPGQALVAAMKRAYRPSSVRVKSKWFTLRYKENGVFILLGKPVLSCAIFKPVSCVFFNKSLGLEI